MSDDLGDRMKMYEAREHAHSAMPRLPIYARLDGKCFSRFTSNIRRPYDERMSSAMIETTKYLVEQTHAVIGYTQSDEISLAWHYPDPKSEQLFGGRYQKIVSILSGLATAKFNQLIAVLIPEKLSMLPVFDCRAFTLPNLDECANAFLWRELDATKNAISMLAQTHFSHKQLQNKNSSQMQEMLWQEKAINFNDMPSFFKRGTFVKRVVEERELTKEEMEKIPENYRPLGPVVRSNINALDMPKFRTVTNRVAVIFEGAEPIVSGELP